jgi:hypothetical protein
MPLRIDDDRLDMPECEISDISFASAEARYALLCARRLRLVLHILGMVLVLSVALVVSLVIQSRRQGNDDGVIATLTGHSNQPVSLGIDPVGSENAKVQVLAILPADSDCHSGVAKLLSDSATLRPDEIRVVFKAMGEFSNDELDKLVGRVCAAVVINGKTDFELPKDGKPRRVSLVGTEPTNYRLGDVGEALTQVYAEQYGPPSEPIYQIQQTSACGGGGGTCSSGDGHGHEVSGETAQPEEKEPVEVILPGKLPAIKGLD